MSFHTEQYCKTLPALSPVEAIRAIHAAWLQLAAATAEFAASKVDNKPTMAALAACMRAAGHPGFQPGTSKGRDMLKGMDLADSFTSLEERELLIELKRNRGLLDQYKGVQPAERTVRADVEMGIRVLMDGDKREMRRMTERLKGNLPPARPL